jgi:hypothetical protein
MIPPHPTAAAVAVALALAGAASTTAAAREPLDNRWRITAVNIQGWHTATYDDGYRHLELDGTTVYAGGRRGKPFRLKLSSRRPQVMTTSDVTYFASSKATFSTNDEGPFTCDQELRNDDAGFAAVLMLRPDALRVQWSLPPVGYDCPDEAPLTPEFNQLPTKATTSRIPLRKLANRKKAILPVDIRWKGAKDDWTEEIVWNGNVHIKRLEKKR